MANIQGTIITLRDFLFNKESTITTQRNDNVYPIISFKKGRILSVPDYQREIRWQKETLFALMNDISRGPKFLGNIILSSNDKINYDIIDGQQRLVSLNMLINYIKANYLEEINDIEDLVKINLNCFELFNIFQEANYNLDNIQDKEIKRSVAETDKLNQIPLLTILYKSVQDSNILNTIDKAYSFLKNLKLCTLNVIVSDDRDSQISTEYYIDVNLKGIKLDTEDIFKGYLFAQDASIKIRDLWIDLKKSWTKFNKICHSKTKANIYPLIKILEHYIYCYILNKEEYASISINENFTLDKQCIVNNTQHYTNEHVIKVVMNNTYMANVLAGSKSYIDFLTEILSIDDGAPASINELLTDLQSSERKIISNFIKKTILDTTLITPKILILKYYLTISNKTASKKEQRYFYAIYFYQVLFMLFGDKKHDIEQIKKIAKSGNYYPEIMNAIKNFLNTDKLIDSKLNALNRYNTNYQNENLQYRCKSLATIYNFFTIQNNCITIASSNMIYKFLTDTEEYSIEHFIISNSQKVKSGEEECQLPQQTGKYSKYIFNFIFIPQTINDSLKNFHIKQKIALLEQNSYLSQIHCDYSKMIIELVKENFIEDVPDSNNENFLDNWDKYWLVTFRNEFKNFTAKIVDRLIERFKNS